MADAKKLIPFILRWEGGFVDDPLDRGGATNKGITIGTFRHFFGSNATVDQLKNMTDAQWLTVFRAGYWDPWRADEIRNQSVADIVVDWAWASGTKTSIRQVQKLLGVTADGVVGPVTLGAIAASAPRELFDRVHDTRIAFVDDIVSRNPSQKRFERGWKNRINALHFSV